MIIYTGYYAKIDYYLSETNFYQDCALFQVSRTIPSRLESKYNIFRIPELLPTLKIFSLWKKGYLSQEEYIALYWRDVLSKADPYHVFNILNSHLVSFILCYENPIDLCHRHLIALWLEHYIKNLCIVEFPVGVYEVDWKRKELGSNTHNLISFMNRYHPSIVNS